MLEHRVYMIYYKAMSSYYCYRYASYCWPIVRDISSILLQLITCCILQAIKQNTRQIILTSWKSVSPLFSAGFLVVEICWDYFARFDWEKLFYCWNMENRGPARPSHLWSEPEPELITWWSPAGTLVRDGDLIFVLPGPEHLGWGLSPRLAHQSAITSDRARPAASQSHGANEEGF